ncbi:beta-L-arabinofuranosidase domain-containing protein [Niabella beijingensis]|uniref:beta-L-arabinofuranosidase domain-containing protein n=1 Tax=Niabella beijingensis TaxID=2872700 RepID=UPI001CBF9285|nr:beta-L-arabinofuranosidase domain-containing protein [Niabella beijingensis]MBZ4191691.1 glycoside hydrolase family 127 protein [Niabella beijingensis]
MTCKKYRILKALCCLWIAIVFYNSSQAQETDEALYRNNRAPLKQLQFLELPLGAIAPEGWLKEKLISQKNGATGKLDELYPLVMGKRNGWLGGDGDQWERGPYWIDGLLPLAYLLKDKALIAKVKPWVEWSLNSLQPNGYFGPAKDYPGEPGIQRDNSQDWWPKMVMLKVLKQYYAATGDKRVIKLMTEYFRYQLKTLPEKPLDHWTFWARYRAGDNLMVVLWLYNITGDAFLLNLADLIHKQTFNYTHEFLYTDLLSRPGSIHCVNLAQGIKEPVVYYQRKPEQPFLDAVEKGFADLRKYNGLANGLFGGDEALHGNDPAFGSEFCTAVEMMFSLESILNVTGDVKYADQLEKIAFNALPAQIDAQFLNRQYYQQTNQVMVTRHMRNFSVDHDGADICFGLLTGYACCTSNMHQGWPKFTQNLWYATADKGLAALVYAPSAVTAKVADGTEVSFKEQTQYPFEETIRFSLETKSKKPLRFPFHLRIPAWCDAAVVKINGALHSQAKGDTILKIDRDWKSGDVVTLELPMRIKKNRWQQNSVSIERGPLTYALKIGEQAKEITNTKDPVENGDTYWEIRPTTPWNYGLPDFSEEKLNEQFKVEQHSAEGKDPWSLASVPLSITAKGKRFARWQLYNESAGPLPYSVTYGLHLGDEEPITLVPYGVTRLRVAQFPVY